MHSTGERRRSGRAIAASSASWSAMSTRRKVISFLVQSSRDGRMDGRLLRHAREQDRELGLAIRIRLRQDRLEMLADGSDADILFIRNFLEIAPAGKADCDSRFRRREAECLAQDG